MEQMKQVFENAREQLGALSFGQRIMVGTVLLGLVLSTVFLFNKAHDDYDVLYANLSVVDASAIVAKLKEAHQPYRLSNNGTTILVPRDQKNQMVLETASELTSHQTINLTQIPPVVQGDVQKEWIKKLNTNAITNILQSIQGIKNAQVIVSQPERSLFEEEDDTPRASVLLIVEPGFRMREEQVKTIKNLVAHAVPGLLPENVAIADNAGNSLTGPGGVASSGMSQGDVRRKNFEKEITKKVLGILGPVVGKENVVVSVSAVLNFDQTQTKIHRVIPAGGSADSPTGLPVSAQEETEEYKNGKSETAAQPGVEANVAPSYQATAETGEEDKHDYRFTKKTTNFTHSEEDKSIVYASGAIERLTVAVVLNKVLTANETEEIKELVKNAAGVDLARGDSIDVRGFQFSQPPSNKEKELAEASKLAQEQAMYLQYASIGSVVLLGLAALVVFYILFRRPSEGELIEEVDTFDYLDEEEDLLEAAPIPVIEAKLDPEVEHMRQAITNMVEENPGEAARVLMAYMKEM